MLMQQEHDPTPKTPARSDGLASLLQAFYSTRSRDRVKDTIGDLRFFARFCAVSDEAVVVLLFGPDATQQKSDEVVGRYLEHMRREDLAYGTIKRRLSVLRSLSRFARLKGIIRWDIGVTAKDDKPNRDTRGVSLVALARADDMAHKADARSRRDRAITFLVHELKLTRLEAVTLDLESYDPDPRQPTVDVVSAKHPISIKTKRALDGWIEERGFRSGALFVAVTGNGPDTASRLAPDDILSLVRTNQQIDYDET